MRFVLIHGFNVRDGGRKSVDQLAPLIIGAGHQVDVDEADYGFWSLWKIILFAGKTRRDVLRRIEGAIEKADGVIGHSNGANFGIQALDALPPSFDRTKVAIWISGAADRDTPIPESVKAQLVLYTPNDIWVRLSSYIPFNSWGRMGAAGYSGSDDRNTNIEVPEIKRHSGWFKPRWIHTTWDYCIAFIKGHS